ncbi:adenylate/guanylate cyclase domain-containing protein [Terracoccus luteus]|jgi:adenylate cyclase|uniref:Adenylate cyclase n=1 Tax=Terracoccus luteus TaxID=53356 RepID=A0A495XSX2_9MICO|nr:adenylate/guanylate cyclase domain-containing protein [Terracoccus luteus]MBB2985485.1 adenylate cyclase [Terracoccus luteus]MCP2171137.1 adenylate cyclase [Terracoccus luteus]RKT77257.1 adenylate cyclase [Terracoccus luteus]
MTESAATGGGDVTERLLGHPLELRRREVSAGAGVSLLSARRFWHALGFPVVDTDDELFTVADQEALASVAALVREGLLDETTALSLTRAFARSTDRLAGWQSQLVAEAVEARLDSEGDAPVLASGGAPGAAAGAAETRAVPGHETAVEVAERLAVLADRLEPLLVYAWRRHLSATVSRLLADADPEAYGLTKMRSVGFADLVSFTALVRRLSERDLARLVSRFEALSADVITAHGGRLIKTVGDEVLFTTVTAAPAAAIALDLVDAMTADDLLPQLRVGMARGPIVSRLGDVFGTTVNRAARLTAVAGSGAVLVDAPMARDLASLSGFELDEQRRRQLRGVGTVVPSLLRRAPASGRRVPRDPVT